MSRGVKIIDYDMVGCDGELSWNDACREGTNRGHYIKVKELIQEDALFKPNYKIDLETIKNAFRLVDDRCKNNRFPSPGEGTFRIFLEQEIQRRNNELTIQCTSTTSSNTP